MNKDEKKAYKEMIDNEEMMREGTTEEYAKDMEITRQKNYPSGANPQDIYAYKLLKLNPESSTDFPGRIDKDAVLANLGGTKPNREYLRFVNDTISFFEEVYGHNPKFNCVINILKGSYKYELVSSRSLGGDREAVLDITASVRKSLEKRKEADPGILGFGGK